MPDVAVVILNFNGWKYTLECLSSLMNLETRPQHIVVCDNGSSDGSLDRIHDWGRINYSDAVVKVTAGTNHELITIYQTNGAPPFILIDNAANLGFSAGNNRGIRYILQHTGSDFVWLLNNDTVVHQKALCALLDFSDANPAMGVIGSTVVYAHDKARVQCAGGCRYHPATTIFRYAFGGSDINRLIHFGPRVHLDYIYGASMFIRADAFRRIGLLNEEHFLFYEEADFCRRVIRVGYQIGWCPKSIIYHKAGATVCAASAEDRIKLSIANYHENLSTLIFTGNFFSYLMPIAALSRFVGKLLAILWSRRLFLLKPLLYAYRDYFCRIK